MATAWDVSTAAYYDIFKYVGSQDTAPTDVFFKPDGTKMYVTGQYNKEVFQYNLSNAWDVSTANYVAHKLVSYQAVGPYGLFFKPDGTKMYIADEDDDRIYQYALSTAWSVSTAVYEDKYKYIAYDATVRGISFKPDGIKMYVTGAYNKKVYQYTLSTPWDVSTATYETKFGYVGNEETNPFDAFFKDDGTKMYVVGNTNDTVYQYSLSTGWDVSTASYEAKYKDVSSEDGTPVGVFFDSYGGKMYIVGMGNKKVYLYSLVTPPDPPTNVDASYGTYTDKVRITWTKSDGATGYQVYRDSTPLGWLGDVATYDDTGAGAPTITPGTATASDATSATHVALSLSGQSVSNGTFHTYKVRARSIDGESWDSSTDTGYRGHGALTYQWQRSDADSDANYSNIPGATTASYNDVDAPENGDGRYYRCVEDATGAAQQISTSDRGYRITSPTVTVDAVSDISTTTATGSGNITDTGEENCDKRGICWNTIGGPDVEDDKSEETNSFGTGAFSRPMTGLSPGTKYYVRAYAHNSAGYSYSPEVDFHTDPVVTTYPPTNIVRVNPTVVTANGSIELDESEDITTRGFKYGETEVPTWDKSETGSYSGGAFSLQITSLESDTTYYIRTYATVSWGTKYGSWLEFKTAYPYGSFKTEIKAEAIASSGDIAAVGGKRSLTIKNHLIQTQTVANLVANNYLDDYKDQKTKLVVTRPTPAPYEIGDTIIRDCSGLTNKDVIIRKLNISFSAGDYTSNIELEG